jgi:hypothetical protein
MPTTGPAPEAERQSMKATGTDGTTHQDPPVRLGPKLGPRAEETGDFLRLCETSEEEGREQKTPGNHGEYRDFQGQSEIVNKWALQDLNL